MAPPISQGIVEFKCDLSAAQTALSHFWEHTVGSAHAFAALRADWQEQLRCAHYELPINGWKDLYRRGSATAQCCGSESSSKRG